VAYDSGSTATNHQTERLCNEVAAEALMPGDEFHQSWQQTMAAGADHERAIKRLALDTGASYSAVTVRAANLNLLSVDVMQGLLGKYAAFYAQSKQREAEKREQRKAQGKPAGGIAQKVVALGRAGPRMTRKALIAYDEGRISSMDLYDIFGVKLNHLPKIAEQVGHHLVRWHGSVDSS